MADVEQADGQDLHKRHSSKHLLKEGPEKAQAQSHSQMVVSEVKSEAPYLEDADDLCS